VAETQPDLTEVQHRLLFAQVLEAVRALEEGVLTDIREGDVGAILGWGFAPWSGGPFSWLDMLGAAYAAERCDALTAAHGDRFACPALLREMAEKGQSFYGRFGDRRRQQGVTGHRYPQKGGHVPPFSRRAAVPGRVRRIDAVSARPPLDPWPRVRKTGRDRRAPARLPNSAECGYGERHAERPRTADMVAVGDGLSDIPPQLL
jgi:hypothetical protein